MLTWCLSITSQKRDTDGIVRHALEHQRGRAVGERPVDDVAVAGHPADIGRAPVDVAVVIVEDVLMRHRGVDEIAAGGVQHALRLAGRARGVEDEERILGLHLLRLAVGRNGRDLVVVPEVAACRPSRSCRRCGARPARSSPSRRALAAMSIALSVFSFSGIVLPPRRPSSAVMTKVDFAVVDAAGERIRREAAEHHRVDRRRCACRRASHRPPRGSSACRW